MLRYALLIAPVLVLSGQTACGAREYAPDMIAVAAGVTVAPDYEGSDDYVATLGLGALVRIEGRSVTWKGNTLAVDLVPEYRDQTFKLVAGPIVGLNFDRALVPHDPVVALTRKRKVALEGGGFIGFARTGVLTSKFDSLSLTIAGAYDLGNVHHSLIVTPSLTYTMPVSSAVMMQASLSADFVGRRYAQYYFGVGSTSSAQSGLPRYAPGAGVKSVTAGLAAAVALNGDLERRGFFIGAIASYERLLGRFAASPVVADRGDANQLSVSVGGGYHF